MSRITLARLRNETVQISAGGLLFAGFLLAVVLVELGIALGFSFLIGGWAWYFFYLFAFVPVALLSILVWAAASSYLELLFRKEHDG